MTPWELLGYYEQVDKEQSLLGEWKNQGRRKVHNLELPFGYAQLAKAFVDHETYDPQTRTWLEQGKEYVWLGCPYTDRRINNAIRLGLHGSLKEHHKNRVAVVSILKQVFANKWASQYIHEHESIVLKELTERVRKYALAYT